MAIVTQTDHSESFRNRCVIEVLVAFLCSNVLFLICVCVCGGGGRGLCHRTESKLFPVYIPNPKKKRYIVDISNDYH